MDYTKVPRQLIYKERKDLDEFGVRVEGTINNYLFTKMRKMTLLRCSDAKDVALKCLNNAYYICTLIQLEEFPDLCMDKYQELLLPEMIPFPEDVYQASMALVCVLLKAYDDKYKQKDDLVIESIYHWTSSNRWTGSPNHKSFTDIIDTCNPEGYIIASDAFAPRDIIEVIENVHINNLIYYTEYICVRLTHMGDKRKRMYGADMAIARLRDDLRLFCNDNQYNPTTNRFIHEHDYPRDYIYASQIKDKVESYKKAIKYIEDHYPREEAGDNADDTKKTVPIEQDEYNKLVSENNKLKKQLKQSTQKCAELEKENKALNTTITELRQPLENLSAVQKVRMELAYQLLKAAGLTDKILEKRNNKQMTAEIMSILLDIHNDNNRGNTAQTCATYLADVGHLPGRHKEIVDKINTLLKELEINVMLQVSSNSSKS